MTITYVMVNSYLKNGIRYNICEICGTEFQGRLNGHGNFYRKTCSSECQAKMREISSKWTEERKEYMSKLFTGREVTWIVPKGKERPNWKGGSTPAYYRNLAFNVYKMEKKCCVSECDNINCLCVHHIDGDRTNNLKENLEIRCKKHHTGKHSEGNLLWKKHLDVSSERVE